MAWRNDSDSGGGVRRALYLPGRGLTSVLRRPMTAIAQMRKLRPRAFTCETCGKRPARAWRIGHCWVLISRFPHSPEIGAGAGTPFFPALSGVQTPYLHVSLSVLQLAWGCSGATRQVGSQARSVHTLGPRPQALAAAVARGGARVRARTPELPGGVCPPAGCLCAEGRANGL